MAVTSRNRYCIMSLGLVLAMLIGSQAAVSAAEAVKKFGRNEPVRVEDYLPHLSSREHYSETWSHGVFDEKGKFLLGFNFVITNFGFGDHEGAVTTELILPSGKRVTCKKEYEKRWSASKQTFNLEFGKNSLSKQDKAFQASINCKNMSMDLRFDTKSDAVKPGSGHLGFGDDGEYGMMFHVPRARVTGTVEYKGKKIDISGIGFADHSYMNIAPYKGIRRWFKFKVNSDEITINLTEMEATRDYSSSRNGWLMIADDNGIIANTTRINFDYDGFIRDKKSSEGYTIPRRVRIAAVDGKKHITGVLLMKSIKEVRDPLAKLDAFRRTAARLKTKPRDYYLECSYKLKIKSPEGEKILKGAHQYRFVYVNP